MHNKKKFIFVYVHIYRKLKRLMKPKIIRTDEKRSIAILNNHKHKYVNLLI